jgi:phage baseplate assembly protein W
MSRADKLTLKEKQREVYSDLLTNFDRNRFTGWLGVVTNENAVKQSLRNLLLTNQGERFYDSNKGSRLRSAIGELDTFYDPELLKAEIKSTIELYEPRVEVENIDVSTNDNNELNITLYFTIINILQELFTLELTIERVR